MDYRRCRLACEVCQYGHGLTKGVTKLAKLLQLDMILLVFIAEVLNTCITLISKLFKRQMNGTVTSMCKEITYILEKPAVYDVMSETDDNLRCFT